MSDMKKIVLADASEEFRRMLAELVAEEPDLTVAGETASGEELLELISTQRPDVVIKYVGGPIYVPPSSDPNYVPVDVKV